MQLNYEAARREAQQQVDAGLIQGGVIATTRADEIIVVGRQCVKPVERPMTEHSRFDIASVGKVFTTACIARYIIEGRVDPDAPITRYIPEYVLGEACEITVRDLAMHVSGFDNSKPYNSFEAEVFDRELFNKRPVRPRLEAFEYACSNFIMLGKIVNRLSGLDLDAFARRHVWGPAGHDRDHLERAGRRRTRWSTGFPTVRRASTTTTTASRHPSRWAAAVASPPSMTCCASCAICWSASTFRRPTTI